MKYSSEIVTFDLDVCLLLVVVQICFNCFHRSVDPCVEINQADNGN